MKKLFTPVQLGSMNLPNRLVRSATMDFFGGLDGSVSTRQVELHRELAENGVGLIITGHVCVSEEGRALPVQNCIYSDKFLEGQRQVAEAVHRAGGKVVLQLSHAGGAGIGPGLIAPSAVPFSKGGPIPREMTREDMDRVLDDFTQGALRAKNAGFDGVQLHGATNYLISEFLSPAFNQREDEYGGQLEGRCRFPLQVLDAVRAAVGPDYPVLIKLNSNCIGDSVSFEEEFPEMCQMMAAHGVTAIEITGYDSATKQRAETFNYYLPMAKRVLQKVTVPILLSGGIRSRDNMENVLEAGVTCVTMSRPFINQPDLAKLLERGEESRCISCSKCFRLYMKERRQCVFHELPEEG